MNGEFFGRIFKIFGLRSGGLPVRSLGWKLRGPVKKRKSYFKYLIESLHIWRKVCRALPHLVERSDAGLRIWIFGFFQQLTCMATTSARDCIYGSSKKSVGKSEPI